MRVESYILQVIAFFQKRMHINLPHSPLSTLHSQLALTLTLMLISSTTTSMVRDNANALYEEYKSAAKYHDESEKKYLLLLENLEKYPKEEYLLLQKQLLRKEIEQNRLLMLQARSEFEKALQNWDLSVQKLETGIPLDSIDLRQIFGLPSPKDTVLIYDEP